MPNRNNSLDGFGIIDIYLSVKKDAPEGARKLLTVKGITKLVKSGKEKNQSVIIEEIET